MYVLYRDLKFASSLQNCKHIVLKKKFSLVLIHQKCSNVSCFVFWRPSILITGSNELDWPIFSVDFSQADLAVNWTFEESSFDAQ